MNRSDRDLFSRFARAHGLGFRQRRFLRRLASFYGLDGSGGPETSAAMVFFRPSYWSIFLRDARDGGNRRLPLERIQELAGKLFHGSVPGPQG